eukprot:UN05627
MTATTYIVNGDAGNREGHHKFNAGQPSWSAYRTTTYSFSKFSVYNATHVHLQQITADSELPAKDQGAVIDDVWFVQSKHGPFEERGEIIPSNDPRKSVTYDPYVMYDIPMKVAPEQIDINIPYISNNKEDYKGMEGVYF